MVCLVPPMWVLNFSIDLSGFIWYSLFLLVRLGLSDTQFFYWSIWVYLILPFPIGPSGFIRYSVFLLICLGLSDTPFSYWSVWVYLILIFPIGPYRFIWYSDVVDSWSGEGYSTCCCPTFIWQPLVSLMYCLDDPSLCTTESAFLSVEPSACVSC